MIRITSKTEGFRRAGISHTREPVDHQDDKFSKEEMALLQAEPMLVVQHVEDSSEGDPEADLAATILTAMAGLDAMDGTLWTESGKPQVKAIEAVLHQQISAADRDAAWKIYQRHEHKV